MHLYAGGPLRWEHLHLEGNPTETSYRGHLDDDLKSWSPAAAASYLDAREVWWQSWPSAQMDHGTVCISCHTVVTYALVRPALRRQLDEKEMTAPETAMLTSIEKRVNDWPQMTPFYTDAANGPGENGRVPCYRSGVECSDLVCVRRCGRASQLCYTDSLQRSMGAAGEDGCERRRLELAGFSSGSVGIAGSRDIRARHLWRSLSVILRITTQRARSSRTSGAASELSASAVCGAAIDESALCVVGRSPVPRVA